ACYEKALESVMRLISDWVRRSGLSVTELTAAARSQLEQLAEELLSEVPEFPQPGAPGIREQYRSPLREAREGALRNIEIGFIGGHDVNATTGPAIYNNITVKDSVVGTINTGEVQKIDVNLTNLHNAGND